MSKHKQAEVTINLTVQFDDDGENSLEDQAFIAASSLIASTKSDYEFLVGKITDDQGTGE